MTSNTNYASERCSFDHARARCTNVNSHAYHRYGGAGVTFYEGWIGRDGFDRFMSHIGPKPSPELTIDRIRNDRGYEPGNVKWSTKTEQNRNRTNSRLTPQELDYVQFIADMFQMSYACIRNRYIRGISNPTELQAPPRVTATPKQTVINREDVALLYRRNMTRSQIANRLGLHVTSVSNIIKHLGL